MCMIWEAFIDDVFRRDEDDEDDEDDFGNGFDDIY